MTFFTHSTTGRRCQLEETLGDLRRILSDEEDAVIGSQVAEAERILTVALELMRGREARNEVADLKANAPSTEQN